MATFEDLPQDVRKDIYDLSMAIDGDTTAVRCRNGKYRVRPWLAGRRVSKQDKAATELAIRSWELVDLSVTAPDGQLPSEVIPIVAGAEPRRLLLRTLNPLIPDLSLAVCGRDYDAQKPICSSETVLVTLTDAVIYCRHLGAHILSVSPPQILRAQPPLQHTLLHTQAQIASLYIEVGVRTKWESLSGGNKGRLAMLGRALCSLASSDNVLVVNEGAGWQEIAQWVAPQSQTIEQWMDLVERNQHSVITSLYTKFQQVGATDLLKNHKVQRRVRGLLDRVAISVGLCVHAAETTTPSRTFRKLATYAFSLIVNVRSLCPDQYGANGFLEECPSCGDHPCSDSLFRTLGLNINVFATSRPAELGGTQSNWLLSQLPVMMRHDLPLGEDVTTTSVADAFDNVCGIVGVMIAAEVQAPANLWVDFVRLGILWKQCTERDLMKHQGRLSRDRPAFAFSQAEMGDYDAGSAVVVLRERLQVLQNESEGIIRGRVRLSAGDRDIAALPLKILRGEE